VAAIASRALRRFAPAVGAPHPVHAFRLRESANRCSSFADPNDRHGGAGPEQGANLRVATLPAPDDDSGLIGKVEKQWVTHLQKLVTEGDAIVTPVVRSLEGL